MVWIYLLLACNMPARKPEQQQQCILWEASAGQERPGKAVDGNYGSESDPGPYPIPLNAPIEQGSDAHVIVVDKDNAMLYELYNANVNGDHWEASSGAVFNLASKK